jgi:exosortase/archaeosortase family protein
MRTGDFNLLFISAGIAFLAFALLLPRREEFLIFLMLLSFLSIFAIVFGEASIIPSILLMIYGFRVAFPILMLGLLGEPSVTLTANAVTAITGGLGLPVTVVGPVLHFNSVNSDVISTAIVAGCAGYTTIGAFISLFALMMLDIRLPLKKAWYIFLLGLVGTWLQNIIRIVVAVTAGYNGGWQALEAIHYNLAYVIFPLWFALFCFIYLKQAGWKRASVTI